MLGFLLVGVFSRPCFAEENQVEGFVRWDGASLEIQDSVVLWDATENELKIALFPFKLTAQDVEAIQKTPSQLGFSLIKKGDLYGSIEISFEEGAEKGLGSISRYELFIYDPSKQIPNGNVTLMGSLAQNDFKKLEFREGRLDMAFVGSLVQDYPSKTEYSWSVELQSEVLTPAAEPQ